MWENSHLYNIQVQARDRYKDKYQWVEERETSHNNHHEFVNLTREGSRDHKTRSKTYGNIRVAKVKAGSDQMSVSSELIEREV